MCPDCGGSLEGRWYCECGYGTPAKRAAATPKPLNWRDAMRALMAKTGPPCP